MRAFQLLLFSLVWYSNVQLAIAQSTSERVEDLRAEWLVNENGEWKSYDSRSKTPGTIYFTIDPLRNSGGRLEVAGFRDFSVWLNGSLLAGSDGHSISLDIDSLAGLTNRDLTIGVHAARGLQFLSTVIVTRTFNTANDIDERRRGNDLVNFSLIVFFILAIYFIALIRSNPRLTMDYFNMARLVSVQERDESLVMGRITSSFSILVYVFIGLWASYLLLIISQFAGTLWIVVGDYSIHDLKDAFVKWGMITAVLFGAVFVKILLVLLMSRIFNIRDGAAVQMLNFFRLLAGLAIVLSVVLIFYFIFDTVSQQYYLNLITIIIWIFGLWAVLIFVKLLNKSSFTLFHIISYLCASEFFPIIILFRVLFF